MSYSILGVTTLGCAALVSTALAEPATWQPSETVATGVTALAPAAGRALAYVEDGWLITYVADGEVVVRERDDATGWGAGVPLTSGAGNVSAPQLAYSGGIVHLVWEDDRNGHPEIYTRRLEEGAWTAEECLSCDGVRSAAASLAAREPFESSEESHAFVVWEEGTVGSTQIHGRYHHPDDGWLDAVQISESTGSASEPSAAAYQHDWNFVFTWTDTRNGHLDIYHRTGNPNFSPELNLTDQFSADASRSSVRLEFKITDFDERFDLVVFTLGTSLTAVVVDEWAEVSTVAFLGSSVDDPSAQASSFAKDTRDFCAFFGGVQTQGEWLATMAKGTPGARQLEVITYSGFVPETIQEVGRTILATSGFGDVHLGTFEGVPDARLMALWIEDDGGVSTLKARRGSEIGASGARLVDRSASLLLSPAGSVVITVEVEEISTGETADCQACLYFLESPHIVFDTGELTYCTHPPSPYEFAIRGGGCDPGGSAIISSEADDIGPAWVGIRSPDVDGDCHVGPDDLAYVESMVGTADFCADLDGSGLVDAGDVDIVEMTLGDVCLSVDVPGSPPAVVAPALALAPNPARSTAFIRLSVPQATTAAVTIFDATGRRVREIALDIAAGSTLVPWDLRDQQGRPAGVGTYFVRAEAGGSVLHATLTVVE